MLNRIIPEFAKHLSVHYADNNIDSLQQLTSDRLLLELHDIGINIRHLGLVRKVHSPHYLLILILSLDLIFFKQFLILLST
jgi:hypothetical protein